MVEYYCELCSYSTHLKPHFERHCKTKKHLSKEKIVNNKKNDKASKNIQDAPKMHPKCTQMHPEAPKKIDNKTCEFCKKSFTRTTGLKKHLNICSYKNMHPNVNKMSTNVNIVSTKCQHLSTLNKNQCNYCMKFFSTRQGKSKHLQTCKIRKKEINNEEKLLLMETKIKELSETNTSLTNNIQNITKINTQNNGTINYLNIHYNNIQPIEQFLENLKTKFQLSNSDRKCLLDTYNECGIDSFADTFSIIMKKNLIKQIKHDILPTMPLVCTDSNLRSIKEYHKDGWKATQSNKSIDQMIDISNEQIYESEQTKMYISQKDRKKVYNKIKQDNTLLSLENEKKNQILKNENKLQFIDNIEIENIDSPNIGGKIDSPNIGGKIDSPNIGGKIDSPNIEKKYDYSIIDDELIEKYANKK